MNQFLVEKYGPKLATLGIEIQIATTGGTYNMPDDNIIRNKRLVGLFVPDNKDDSAYSPSGRPLVSNAAIRSSYLTLKAGNDDVLSEHPLSDLLITEYDREVKMVDLCDVNPQRSTIFIGNAAALVAAGDSIIVQFIYVNE